MLNNPIWENFLKYPLANDNQSFEFYADSVIQRRFNFEPKASSLRTFETGGAQLILPASSGLKVFHSEHLDPYSFSEFVEVAEIKASSSLFNRRPEGTGKTWNRNRDIEQACRRILLEAGNLTDFQASYEETIRSFLFASSNKGSHQGHETFASFAATFLAHKGDQVRRFTIHRGRTSIDALLNDLEQTLITREYIDRALQHPWPAPQGPVNILWSASSVAKFLLHFFYQLESASGSQESFEGYKQRFPQLAFQVIDNWKQGNRIDVEGRDRKESLIIDGGHVPCLFNEHFSGFSRRSSPRDFPITAPWEPALFGLERDSDILAQLGNGLFVREIEITSFKPISGVISFKIAEASLVHQGVEGELIEPVKIECSLLDLFHTFKLFSDSTKPHPLTWSKSGQNLFVEVSTPEAISPSFEFPGTVPLSHYW